MSITTEDVESLLHIVCSVQKLGKLGCHFLPLFEAGGRGACHQAVEQFRMGDENLGKELGHTEQGNKQLQDLSVFSQEGVRGGAGTYGAQKPLQVGEGQIRIGLGKNFLEEERRDLFQQTAGTFGETGLWGAVPKQEQVLVGGVNPLEAAF